MIKAIMTAAVFALLCARGAAAQTCGQSSGTTTNERHCNSIAHTTQIIQPGVGIAFAGGNPVPGASSTLGMRIGSVPRITVGGRVTGVFMDVPNVTTPTSTGNGKGKPLSFNVDAGVGIFSGLTIAPTLGGFGSIDAIVSAGKMKMPEEFGNSEPGSWAAGLRIGLLRESFTAPGVSVTAMYRSIGNYSYGVNADAPANANLTQAYFENNTVQSLRAIVGKRIFVLGANVGVGYDKFSSDVSGFGGGLLLQDVELKEDRLTAFANVSWTLIILNAVAEAGFVKGGDPFTSPLPTGQTSQTEKATYYGSLALRLAL